MNITIDASVFISATLTAEPRYAVSRAFLNEMRAAQTAIFCPSLVLPECAAAVARRTGNSVLALTLVMQIENWPGMRLVQFTEPNARRAAEIAATQRLRGADSVYVAVAEEFNATLVTWDGEMLQRGATLVTTMTPDDWLKAQQTNSSQPK